MAVFRIVKDKSNPYVMINRYSLYDKKLSYKAKGILNYCLSRPDDWEFYEEEITKHSTDGLASIRTGLKELIDKGYIVRKRKRDNLGKFKGYEYLVYELPQNESLPKCDFPKTDNPRMGNPRMDYPLTDNRILLNNDLTNKRDKLNNDISSSNNKGNIEVFKHFEKCNFGLLSPMLMEKIAADIEIYSKEWVVRAAEVADEQGKHSYAYVKGILTSWKTSGGIQKKKEGCKNRNSRKDSKRSSTSPYDFSAYEG